MSSLFDAPVPDPTHDARRRQALNGTNLISPSPAHLEHTTATSVPPNGLEVPNLTSADNRHYVPTSHTRTPRNPRPPQCEGTTAGSSWDRPVPRAPIERKPSIPPPVPTKEGVCYPTAHPTRLAIDTSRTFPALQSDTSPNSTTLDRPSSHPVPDSGIELSYRRSFRTGLPPHLEETDLRGGCTAFFRGSQIDDTLPLELQMHWRLKTAQSRALASPSKCRLWLTDLQINSLVTQKPLRHSTKARDGRVIPSLETVRTHLTRHGRHRRSLAHRTLTQEDRTGSHVPLRPLPYGPERNEDLGRPFKAILRTQDKRVQVRES